VRSKEAERLEARTLRHAGLPYRKIAQQLRVSVNSAYRWTNDIRLSAAQREYNLRGPTGPQNPEHIRRRMAAWSAKCRATRAAYQKDGRAAARLREPLHLAGCMLYWAEGAKSRNQAKFTNSDVRMLRLFRDFLVESLGVDIRQITLRLNVYTNNGLSVKEIESHWLDALELPRTCLRKHALNHTPTSSSGRAKGRLPYGVATLTLSCTQVVQHISGAIQEYAGFDEPAWLD
jgi:hypothetical protein